MATEVKKPVGHAEDKSSEELVVERARNFWTRYSRFVVYGLAAIVLIIGGIYVYNNYVKGPEEEHAVDAMWKAEQYFKQDSFQLALNGSGRDLGFLKVMSKYSGTKAAGLAHFYAGVCYIQLGDFKNAIKYLKDFNTDAKDIQLRTYGLLGDAYSELGQKKEAIDYYKKAGTYFDKDVLNSGEYLYRAAILSQDLGNNKEAIDLFRTIREKYPMSPRAFEVEKYLARLGEYK